MGTPYKCSACQRQLASGDFMAVIGEVPATGLSAPVGRANVIIAGIGQIYCRACFEKQYPPVKKDH